jgi:hypothetical protein
VGSFPISKDQGQEKIEKQGYPDGRPRRWLTEAASLWMDRFHKIPVRFEELGSSYLGLPIPAGALTAFRKTPVIQGQALNLSKILGFGKILF